MITEIIPVTNIAKISYDAPLFWYGTSFADSEDYVIPVKELKAPAAVAKFLDDSIVVVVGRYSDFYNVYIECYNNYYNSDDDDDFEGFQAWSLTNGTLDEASHCYFVNDKNMEIVNGEINLFNQVTNYIQKFTQNSDVLKELYKRLKQDFKTDLGFGGV